MIFKNFFSKLVFFQALFCCIIIGFDSVDANAQEKNNNKGQVTGLPIPRFVSVKSSKVNVRRGPSSTYQIDWDRIAIQHLPLASPPLIDTGN